MMGFFKVPKEVRRKLQEEARDAAKGVRHPSFENDDGELETLDLPERSAGTWAGAESDPLKAIEKWEDVKKYSGGKGWL
ncbi:MAG: hypothetical protein Q4F00_10195 [bacterium]|nr:hypothetical protein [bacterium]